MPWNQLGIPFQRSSHTSYKAAAAERPRRRADKMARLLDAYKDAGERGLTNLECAERTGLPLQSVCSLRAAAVDCGLLTRAGERVSVFGKANDVFIWRDKGSE